MAYILVIIIHIIKTAMAYILVITISNNQTTIAYILVISAMTIVITTNMLPNENGHDYILVITRVMTNRHYN